MMGKTCKKLKTSSSLFKLLTWQVTEEECRKHHNCFLWLCYDWEKFIDRRSEDDRKDDNTSLVWYKTGWQQRKSEYDRPVTCCDCACVTVQGWPAAEWWLTLASVWWSYGHHQPPPGPQLGPRSGPGLITSSAEVITASRVSSKLVIISIKFWQWH